MPSSEYKFPIFISSPEYNLIDLRAELAQFLSDLGYDPILSSAEGFPDYTPELQPWESCLQVLDSTFITILIIDGRYGTPLEWHGYPHLTEEKISPTHGEYRFAKLNGKRLLVFIREGLLAYYQVYREALKKAKFDRATCERRLKQVLPKNIEYRTLEFINEVKTTFPIPWCIEFKNVVGIKKEIQKKLLNELADVFLFKQKHLDAIFKAFEIAMNELPSDKKDEILSKLGITKGLVKSIEDLTKEKSVLEASLTKLELELNTVKDRYEKNTLKMTAQMLTEQYIDVNSKVQSENGNMWNTIVNNFGGEAGKYLGAYQYRNVLGSDGDWAKNVGAISAATATPEWAKNKGAISAVTTTPEWAKTVGAL